MRFLGIGDDTSLADMYLRLMEAGHEVRVHASYPPELLTLTGTLRHVADWRNELAWIKEAGRDGIVIFENTKMGEVQDELRRDGFHVIGGSAFGDRLEDEREFGQQCMRDAGLKTAPTRTFSEFAAGIDFVRRNPGRYVFKVNGNGFASGRNYVGELDDGRDILALLSRHETVWTSDRPPSFVLMDHLSGVEVGVGGYFNGRDFMAPVVIDWEHKRFFNDDLGELTGEMGTLLSYDHSRPLFEATLARMTEQLRANGYVGYININTIVNDAGIWPLEFTCRFGDPGHAICDALHIEGWAEMFGRMIARERTDFAVRPGFALGVVLTVPPFPYPSRYARLSKGQSIFFREPLTPADRRNMHLNEVEFRDGEMLASGEIGYLMVVTGCGPSVEAARSNAYGLAKKIVTPNLRYRTDIGLRFLAHDRARLQQWGLWPTGEGLD